MKKALSEHRYPFIAGILLLLLSGIGLYLRLYHLGRLSFWHDEIANFNYSRGDLQSVFQAIRLDPNMALYDLLASGWIHLFPQASDAKLRSLSVIFSVISIPAVYWLGKAILPKQKKGIAIGLVTAFLVTLNAFHVQYAQEFRAYSLIFLLTVLSTACFIKMVLVSDGEAHWIIGYALFSAAAVYSHFYTLFLIAAQWISLSYFLFQKPLRIDLFKRVLFSGLGIAVLVAPIGVTALQLGPGGIAWISLPTPQDLLNFYVEIAGNQGIPLLVLTIVFGLIGFLAGVGILLPANSINRWKYVLITCCLLLPVIFSLAGSWLLMPIFIDRYLFYTLPYLTLLVSTGIVSIGELGRKSLSLPPKNRLGLQLVVLAVFGFLSVQGLQNYYKNFQKEDLRKAADLLSAKCSNALRLYDVDFLERDVMNYDPSLISQEREWWKNVLDEKESPDQIVRTLPKDYDKVCLTVGPLPFKENAANQRKALQSAIRQVYPKLSTIKLYSLDIEIYRK